MTYSNGNRIHVKIVPNITEYVDRGYLNILDTNNTYFDYDSDIDNDWFDIKFPKGSPVPRSNVRRRKRMSTRLKRPGFLRVLHSKES